MPAGLQAGPPALSVHNCTFARPEFNSIDHGHSDARNSSGRGRQLLGLERGTLVRISDRRNLRNHLRNPEVRITVRP
jgi:hypothetical protein